MKPFQQHQKQFVEYLRDPENNKRPTYATDARLQVYERLLFNNVSGFIETAFPVLNSIVSDNDWTQLVRQFFVQHTCDSPFFIDISKQFLEFIMEKESPLHASLPYLTSLAHYEWLELSVSVREDSQRRTVDLEAIDESFLILSNAAEPASYNFPVHKISEENAFDTIVLTPLEQPVYLVLYRKEESSIVSFLEVNAVTALTCSYLQNRKVSFGELLDYLHEHLPQYQTEQLKEHLLDMVQYLMNQNIIYIV